MKNNEIDCFDINDQKILFCQSKVKESINKKVLLKAFEKYFENYDDIDIEDVSNFVLESRDVKIKENIKRK